MYTLKVRIGLLMLVFLASTIVTQAALTITFNTGSGTDLNVTYSVGTYTVPATKTNATIYVGNANFSGRNITVDAAANNNGAVTITGAGLAALNSIYSLTIRANNQLTCLTAITNSSNGGITLLAAQNAAGVLTISSAISTAGGQIKLYSGLNAAGTTNGYSGTIIASGNISTLGNSATGAAISIANNSSSSGGVTIGGNAVANSVLSGIGELKLTGYALKGKGVRLNNTTLQTTSGAIVITGRQSGSDATTNNIGVYFDNSSNGPLNIFTTSGPITITGYSDATNGLNARSPISSSPTGLFESKVYSESGNITLDGIGFGGANGNAIHLPSTTPNYVYIGYDGSNAGTTGDVTIKGGGPSTVGSFYLNDVRLKSNAIVIIGDNGSTLGAMTIPSGMIEPTGSYKSFVIGGSNTSSIVNNCALTTTTNGVNITAIGNISGSGSLLSNGQTITMSTTSGTGISTYTGNISGTSNIIKAGAGILTIEGVNTYTGTTTLNGGVLKAGVASPDAMSGPFGNKSSIVFANTAGVSLDLNGKYVYVGLISGGGTTGGNIINSGAMAGTLVIDNAANTTYSGLINGTTNIQKEGAGTLTFARLNTYTGTTTINGGVLQAGISSTIATNGPFGNNSKIIFANTAGSTLDLNGKSIYVGSLEGGGTAGGNTMNSSATAGTLVVGGNALSTTYSGFISGLTNIQKVGAGTLMFEGLNTYTGSTTLNDGVLKAGVASPDAMSGPFGNKSSIVFANTAGVSLDLNSNYVYVGPVSGGGTTGGNIINSGAMAVTLVIDNAANTTYSGLINGTTNIQKEGAGTLTLSRVNTYIGTTTINGGVLQAGIASPNTTSGPFGNRSDIVFANTAGASLDLNGKLVYVGSLNGGGTLGGNITLPLSSTLTTGSSSNASYGGIISGPGQFAKDNGNTQTLTGVNTYTFNTTINDGKLVIGGSGSLNGGNYSSIIAFSNNSTFEYASSANQSLTGQINGAGNLSKTTSGSSTLTIGNSGSTYTGYTTITAGTCKISPNAITTTNTSVVFEGGTFSTVGIALGRNWTCTKALQLNNNTTIQLDVINANSIKFASSAGQTWTSGKTLIINGWLGAFDGNSTGTTGKIFIGSSAAELTAGQLSQIRFYNAGDSKMYTATLLASGELVPYQEVKSSFLFTMIP